MHIVIGSTAIKHHFPEFAREPKDYDAFSSWYPEGNGDIFWDERLRQHWWTNPERVATPDELYTVKLSHSAWELPNGSWNKHMSDLMFLKHKGATCIEPLYKLLYEIWEEKHGKKKMSLNQDASEFFDDAVRRKYDHDSIHYSVAYTPGKPLYESVMEDGASVKTSMKKVWALPFEDQVRLFREEIYATALERIVVPRNYVGSPGLAYHWALRRTITSLTKGKSSRFIAENYDIFHRPDMDYVAHHRKNSHFLIAL